MRAFLDKAAISLLDGLTFLGAIVGGYVLITAIREDSAIRAAADAGVALGIVAIPYALAGMYHRILVRERWKDGKD